MDLKEKAKALPECPGVYLMKDFSGSIIYVGKSKCLRNRVSQYFQSSKNHPPKVVKMVQGIRDFEFIITDTEFEALLLECRLIKEIMPMYNSQMKNHKKYAYIKITINEEYPRILAAEEKYEDGSLYFGPYTSLKSVERTASAIRDALQIGNCSNRGSFKSSSGCLNYQMGLCLGACVDQGLKTEYLNRVNQLIAFLNGKSNYVLEIMEKRMQEAAEKLDFTKAAKYRDDIYSLKHIENKQRVIKFNQNSRNIVAVEYLGNSDIKIFLINDSRLLHEEMLSLLKTPRDYFKSHLIDIILKNFKPACAKMPSKVDKENIDQAQIIFSYLKNCKDCTYLIVPKAWVKDRDKLDTGLDKLVSKLYK